MTNEENFRELQDRLEVLGHGNVASALSRRHGLPGLNALSLGLAPLDTRVSALPTRFPLAYWFAKPPAGTPWPTVFMHHTFETCWLSRHDERIGGAMYGQLSMLPRQAQMLMLWQTCGISWWINNNGITVFPEDHLVEACSKTDVLDCVSGSDVHPAYPYLMFGLSDKSRITNANGKDWINYVNANFIDNGKEEIVQFGKGNTLGVRMPGDCPRYIIINAFWKSGFVSSFAIPLREHVSLKDTIAEFSNDFIDDEFRQHTMSKDQLDAEHEETATVGKAITAMVFNLCLLMQSYPDYVARQPQSGDRQLRMRTMPPPATYRVNDRTAPLKPPPVAESVKPKDEEGVEQKQTVAPHWRRGHWRRQPHTAEWEVGNPQVKVVLFTDGRRAHMVWIRPIFVSGNR